uniref:helix-turn-helix domain-containing protein n=2 Tax=Mycobacteriaceae TaxID=1762 RepID=UPI0034CFD261
MCGASAAAHLVAVRWEALLDEAVRLASTGGYDAVQMRVIAKHAGMAVGTLYR